MYCNCVGSQCWCVNRGFGGFEGLLRVFLLSAGLAGRRAVELNKLSRKHGFKIVPGFSCSVEECSLAVGELVGYSSIESAARMNSSVVIFVDDVNKANKVVEAGIVMNDTFLTVSPLSTPAHRVTISNIPPFSLHDPQQEGRGAQPGAQSEGR